MTTLPVFLTSFGLGLLMGLEREHRPGAKAGLRTFALASVLGTVAAVLAQQSGAPWPVPAVLLIAGLTMVVADAQLGAGERPDTTTTLALVLSCAYGAMLGYGIVHVTVALALGTTALLHFKAELHDASQRVTRADLVSILQFGAITFVVLPVLPDRGFGPYGAVNPHQVWLMVVLVAGIGLAGYAALRLAGPDRAPGILGLLGGLVSSTATTLVYARRARQHADEQAQSLVVILTANLVLLVRLAVICVAVVPGALAALLPVLALGFVAGVAGAAPAWRATRHARVSSAVQLTNPVELLPALGFGLAYGVALVITAWVHDSAGESGLYVVAPLLGMTDMDAIALSTLSLQAGGKLDSAQASVALVLAIMANLAFKATVAGVVGGHALAGRVTAGFAAVAAGLLAGLAVAHAAA